MRHICCQSQVTHFCCQSPWCIEGKDQKEEALFLQLDPNCYSLTPLPCCLQLAFPRFPNFNMRNYPLYDANLGSLRPLMTNLYQARQECLQAVVELFDNVGEWGGGLGVMDEKLDSLGARRERRVCVEGSG